MGLWGLAPIPAAMIARRRARRARGEAPRPANDNAPPGVPSTETTPDGATTHVPDEGTDDAPGETTDASGDAVSDAPGAPEEASASDVARGEEEVAR